MKMRNVRTNLSLKSLPQSKKNTSRLWEYFLQHIKFFSCANVYGDKVWSEMLRNEISGYAKKFCTKESAHVVKDRSLSTFDSISKCVLLGFVLITPRHSKIPTHGSLLTISSSNLWTDLKALASTQILLPILMSTKTFLWLRLQAAYVELDSFE